MATYELQWRRGDACDFDRLPADDLLDCVRDLAVFSSPAQRNFRRGHESCGEH